MLDPRVQQKGGFGAFAAREQERRDGQAAERALAATQGDATGEAGEAPLDVRTAAAPPTVPAARRRWT